VRKTIYRSAWCSIPRQKFMLAVSNMFDNCWVQLTAISKIHPVLFPDAFRLADLPLGLTAGLAGIQFSCDFVLFDLSFWIFCLGSTGLGRHPLVLVLNFDVAQDMLLNVCWRVTGLGRYPGIARQMSYGILLKSCLGTSCGPRCDHICKRFVLCRRRFG